MMFRRILPALRHARREEEFVPIAGAAVSLVIVGTVAYALGEGWHVVDALYFAVSTLTTTSVSDPELVLEHRWMKVFTVLYLLVGIGILVEVLRRLGVSFIAVRKAEKERTDAGQAAPPA